MPKYTTIEELKQFPIEHIKKELDNPSETVLKYTAYMLEHRDSVVVRSDDYAILQQMITELENPTQNA